MLDKLVLLGAISLAIPAAAGAKQPWLDISQNDEAIAARISFADLDLRSQAGVQSLHHRVGYAAREVCVLQVDNKQPLSVAVPTRRNCSMEMINAARPQINRALGAGPRVEVISLVISGLGR